MNSMNQLLAKWSNYLMMALLLSSCLPIQGTAVSPFPQLGKNSASVTTSNDETIDKHALNSPDWAERSLPSLAGYLTQSARRDRDKARAIYRWITNKIDYDEQNLLTGSGGGNTSPEKVLLNRQTVSEGYARLFQRLGELAGLEVEIITGYSKSYSYSVEQPHSFNHVWNAVKLAGQWQLVDTTWGTGYWDEEKKQLVRLFQPHYFLTPPAQFIADHFPNDPQWQLLSSPISKAEYEQRVYPRAVFFATGLAIGSHSDTLIHANRQANITILGQQAAIKAQLLQSNYIVDSSHITIKPQAGQYEIQATFPRPGSYILRLFVKPASDLKGYQWALDYKILVKESLPISEKPVYLEPVFTETGLQIDSHPYQLITANQQLQVTLLAPATTLVSAILYQDGNRLDKSLTFVQRNADKYEIDAVFPQTGKYMLRLFAKHQNEADYRAAVDYTIEAQQAISGKVGFPKIDAPFKERHAYLYYPKQAHLATNKTQRFKLMVPSAVKVAVVSGEQWSLLQKQGNIFAGEAIINPGTVTVYAKFTDAKKYASLLQYQAD
jgi:transglutaminase/protease-like cytokinesis protein 3